ncbi:ATP-dependent DNA helicase UvrD2 [Nocardia sp. 2]|uniref:DNA 3'-5' helicase n=1 Tax=Nocardia acididurans TaxID=2802282 RepID=A0ABS1M6Y9_9NOCA|nr:ATP-dependent DNA helicase UvrD2 [Nocardia acididurans]MBL1076351.1 ATP-dependent DNA helicase UvrD2 [Nocardia acididurans]
MERVTAATTPKLRLDDLDAEQAAAVRAPRGPVCVLAGAGTGKTRTITHRIAHLVSAGHVRADQVLAVTFTARAAGELRNRLRELGLGGDAGQVQARTFHAAALRQLKYFWPQVIGDVPWRLIDSKFPIVAQAARGNGLSTDTDSLRDLTSEIEWAKGSLIAPEDYAAEAARLHRDAPYEASKVAAVYAGYEAAKITPDGLYLDFDDLLLHTAAALEDNVAVAEEFRGRYRCFVVDEYQDVTPLQQRVLDAWLGERDDLTVVGDANQTIYSFTGASPAFLLDFSRRFPEATVVRLERDYRSTPQVVSLANRVIGAARGRIAGTRLQLIGQRPDGAEPVFAEFDDEPAEAAGVARAVGKLLGNGVPAAEIAILYRINAQSEAYEQALTEAGIPYQVRGGEGFFNRPEVRQAVQALRQAHARDDIPDARGANLVTLVRAVLRSKAGLTKEEPVGAQARERWASLMALVQLTEELAAQHVAADTEAAGESVVGAAGDSDEDDQHPTAPGSHHPADESGLDLTGLLRELATRSEARHPPTVQGVTLASLHAAKGLEWDAVFLVGLADGTLPIQHVLGPDGTVSDETALEEERRLLYVGVTRAREHLQLSWALARSAGRKGRRRRSRFLAGLVPDDSPASRIAQHTTDRRGPKRVLPGCRICGRPLLNTQATMLGRCSRCPADIDNGLLEALKDWRREKADELSLPHFVVFSDTTLTAIAEQRPADDRALVAIPGIGAKKLQTYGADVLAIVRARSNASD